MLFKWQSENVRMAIAVLSFVVSVAFIVFIECLPEQQKQDQAIWNHICLLQIIASLWLFVGSLKFKHFLFLPWLLIASIFAYMLIYKSLNSWMHISSEDLKTTLLVIALLYILAGFWIYFIYSVLLDFLEMQSLCLGCATNRLYTINNRPDCTL